MVPHFFLLLFGFALTVRLDLSEHGCFRQNRGLITYQAEQHVCYQLANQLESTVFFSYNKTASAGLSAGFNTSRTEAQKLNCTQQPHVCYFSS